MILGFIVAHCGMVIVIGGCIVPRYYDICIPPHRRAEGTEETVAMEPKGEVVARAIGDGVMGESEEDEEKRGAGREKVSGVGSGSGSGSGHEGAPEIARPPTYSSNAREL
jgi:hypothetical protein